MSQSTSRAPQRHDEQRIPEQRAPGQPTEWISLYHREGVPVRPDDHPIESGQPEDWGWHGEMGKWGRRLWVLPFALIVAYLVTDLRRLGVTTAVVWLIAIGLLMVLLVIVDRRRRKTAWRSR